MSYLHVWKVRLLSALMLLLLAANGANRTEAANLSWLGADGNWSNPVRWQPFGVPSPADVAFIGNLGVAETTVSLDQNDTIAGLVITNQMSLNTGGNNLFVSGNTSLDGGAGFFTNDSRLNILQGSIVTTQNLTLSNGASVFVDDGRYDITGTATIDADSRIFGDNGSTIRLLGNSGPSFVNDGELLGQFDGGLTITQFGTGRIDLDGASGNGSVLVNRTNIPGTLHSTLTINGDQLHDDFNGVMRIAQGGTANMNLTNGWTMGSGSSLRFGNELNQLNGGAVTLSADIRVFGDGLGRINTDAILTDTANVEVSKGGNLEFHGATTLEGGTFSTFSSSFLDGKVEFNGPTTWAGNVTTNGFAQQNGDATVTSTSTITANSFDMDGTGGNTTWHINARLEVNADQIDSSDNHYDGTINIGAGILARLEVNITDPSQPNWIMDGTLNLNSIVLGSQTKLSGSPVRVTGTFNASNHVGVNADASFTDSSTIDFANVNTILRFNGNTKISAGTTISGVGILENGANGLMSLDEGLSIGPIGLVNRGELQLGNTVGVVAVDRFENVAGATLFADVGKNNGGTDSDVLSISAGTADLAGDLQPRVVQISGDNQPLAVGDSFTVLTAVGGLNGTFEQVLDSFQGGHTFTWDVTYNPSNVEIELTSFITGLLGDYDYDGDVDGSDFMKWQSTFGSTTNLMADGNLDGIVNASDLTIWEDNLGAVALIAASVAVPEPTTLALAIFGIAGTIFRRRNN